MSTDMSEEFSTTLDASENETVAEKLNDLILPGFAVEMTPDEAEELGAFEETALSEEDALDAAYDEEIGTDERE